MGNGPDKEEIEYYNKYFAERERASKREAEEKIRMINYQTMKLKQENQRRIDNAKKQAEKEIEASADQLNRQRINFILKNQKFAGYNINPYGMSSSELEYWVNKIENKITDDTNKRIHKINNTFETFINNI